VSHPEESRRPVVAPTQINYLIPAGLAEGGAVVKVLEGSRVVRAGIIQIRRIAPSIFTVTADGKGIPAAFIQRVKADGDSVYELISRFDATTNRHVETPIDLGPETDRVFLSLLGTGLRNRDPAKGITAKIGDTPVEVLYAGLQPTLPGVDQINLALPRSLLGRGKSNVNIAVEGESTNTVQINIK